MMRRFTLVALLAACSGNGTGPADGPSLRVLTSPGATDSVTATPLQGLVVEVRDETGRPAPGVIVRFTGLRLPSGQLTMYVGSAAGSGFGELAVDTTDASGRALARVFFGPVAGPGRIEATVPLFGLADTAHFTVVPGAAAAVNIFPQDTALYSGTSLQLHGGVVDRFNNARPDPVGFTVFSTPAAIGSVTPTGLVSTTGLGRVGVVAATSQARDTAFLSVVPRGTFAAYDQSKARLITVGLDGSGYQLIGPPQLDNYFEPAWSPDGMELVVTPVFGGQPEIQRLALNGSTVSITLPTVPGLAGPAYWPAYSPDGQFIYFTNVNGIAGGIWRVRTDGSTAQAITSGAIHYRPTLSPDGQSVAFHAVSLGEVVIRVFEIQTQSYLGGDTPGLFPEWSPVGDSVAFVDTSGRLRLMHRSGSGNRLVTGLEEQFNAQQLAWSRDGLWILARAASGLKLVEVRTGLILPLGFGVSFANPAWRPGS